MTIALFCGVILLFASGFLLLFSPNPAEPIGGIVIAVIVILFAVYKINDRRAEVELTDIGIKAKYFRGKILFWDTIESVEVKRVGRKMWAVYVETTQKTFSIQTDYLNIDKYKLAELIHTLASMPAEERVDFIMHVNGVRP